MSSFPICYVSYDRFPAPKGAAVHIEAFASALADRYGAVRLITLANPDVAESTLERSHHRIAHTPLHVSGRSLVDRVIDFRRQLRDVWPARRPRVVHIRSIFEGYPIASRKREWCDHLVYEVNGLPSIELKYHYPRVADDEELLGKLRHQEHVCMENADRIITVSPVNADHLIRQGVPENKIRVIPNGVNTDQFPFQRVRASSAELRLLYVGTLTSWQGIRCALEAMALYVRDDPARLSVIGHGRERQRRALLDYAERLGISDRLDLQHAVPQSELAAHYHASDAVLAPLQPNDRNLTQGCCPLKVLEAMATGTPLIASDLPVVRCLARNGVDAFLVRPGSAKAIKDAMLRLRRDPHAARQMAASARRRVKSDFTWSAAQRALIEVYEGLL